MAEKENKKNKNKNQEPEQAPAPEPREGQAEAAAQSAELQQLQEKLDAEHEAHLRLAAEYDNFRKRTQKEKDASYANGKADTLVKLLPVYDNLERALKQETADEAYRKGVEMTMNQLRDILAKLGVTEIEAVGQKFDPALHNAVMHLEDDQYGEGEIVLEFEKGFKLGDKVIRFAMVKVVN